MKRLMSRVAAMGAVLVVLAAALTIGIMHAGSTHAATSQGVAPAAAVPAAAFGEGCPSQIATGARSTWVQLVQFQLNAYHSFGTISFSHYPLATDGIFGANTQAAVAAYQHKVMEIAKPGGVVNAQTWVSMGFCTGGVILGYIHLGAGPDSSRTHCPAQVGSGSSGVLVTAIQLALNKDVSNGPLSKTYGKTTWFPLARDGKYGPKTEDAVKALQAYGHIPQDGIAGKQVWEEMGMCY